MSRLTKKQDNGFYTLKEKEQLFNFENEIKFVQIIGKYEDLEEQLGFSLEKLQETNVIYAENGNELKEYEVIGFNFKEKKIWFFMDFCPMYLSFSDYKKMFWLKEDKSE